jgi:hypothetical protein
LFRKNRELSGLPEVALPTGVGQVVCNAGKSTGEAIGERRSDLEGEKEQDQERAVFRSPMHTLILLAVVITGKSGSRVIPFLARMAFRKTI